MRLPESKGELLQFRRALLRWYDAERRALPWRGPAVTPYATLVSEFMLQQTQVATVIPYFERFMRRFPTLADLARARIQTVLRYWAGLGYYRRCHHLHAAAGRILREHSGEVPHDPSALRGLPGVGAYTSGAIASIAYGVRTAAVDGNVRRVLGRVRGTQRDARGRGDGRDGGGLEEFASRLVPPRRPGDFNQALMELGATVCLPRRPQCDICPLRAACAYVGTSTSERARAKPLPGPHRMELVALAVERGGRLLYVRRPSSGLWAGLWSWPTRETASDREGRKCAIKLAEELALGVGLDVAPLGTIEHRLTHRLIRFHAFHVPVEGAPTTTRQAHRERQDSMRWQTCPDAAHEARAPDPLPRSAAQHKLEALWETLRGRRAT